jgi:hypothetical protein
LKYTHRQRKRKLYDLNVLINLFIYILKQQNDEGLLRHNMCSVNLTLYGRWIVIYLHNNNQPDALHFLIYSNKYPLHVSNRLTTHPQQAVYSTCSLWYLSCIHVDWLLTRSSWNFGCVEDNYLNKLGEKFHQIGSYYADVLCNFKKQKILLYLKIEVLIDCFFLT